MVHHTPRREYPVPDDGESAPADGVDGPMLTVGDIENWGDTLQTALAYIDEDMQTALSDSASVDTIDNSSVTTNTLTATYNATTGVHDLREYGADPSGSTESDAALVDAIAAAEPHDTILLKDGEYRLLGDHVVTKPLTIRGNNATVTRPTNNTLPLIRFQGGGPTGTESGLSSAVERGEAVLPVADASLFSTGDDVMVTDGAATRDAEVAFDFASVRSVDTTNGTVTIDAPTTYSYADATNGAGKVAIVDLLDGPQIQNLDCRGTATTNSWFLMEWCKDPLYEGVDISNYTEETLYSFACLRPTWRDCTVRWANDRSSGNGEAVKASKCQGARVINPFVSECRRGVDFVRYSHDNYVENPVVKKYSISGVSTHGSPCRNTTVVGGVLTGDATVTGGSGIYNNDHKWSVRGTAIQASGEGIAANGNLSARDVDITPIDADAEYAISIVAESNNNNNNIQARIRDPDGHFGGANGCVAHINALGASTANHRLDLDIEVAGTTGVRVLAETGNVVENLTLSGRVDRLASGAYGVRLEGALRNFESTMDVVNGTNEAYLLNDGDFVEGLRLRDLTAEATDASAVVIGTVPSSTNRLWVSNCDLIGSPNALDIQRSDAADVTVWGNRTDGAINVASTQDSVTVEQGDGSNLDADLWDGRDAVESATAPDTANHDEGDWWAQPQS